MSAKAEKTETSDKSEKSEGGKKKLPLSLIIGVVVLIIGMFIGKAVLGGSKKDTKAEKLVKQEVGLSLPLDEFLVNLNGGGDHYLRAQISLGLRKGMTEEEGKEHVAPMRDAILSVLSAKSLAQITKPKDREALKEEIKTTINASMSEGNEKDKGKDGKEGKETVVKVYFTAFATQ